MKKAGLIFSLLLISFFASAQTLKELNDSLIHYYKTADYGKGIIVGEKALIASKKEFGENHPDYATSLNNVAFLYESMGLYAKAEPLYMEAMGILKKALGETHPDYATSLNNLAGLFVHMGQYAKAEPLYIQAMGIRKKALGETHPKYANSLNNLASLYASMGEYTKAEPLYIEAMGIRKKALVETHPDYATSLNNLAGLYKSMGQYAKAEPLYMEAMGITKKALGETHPAYATSLNSLALLYASMGEYAKAEPLYMEAMGIRKKALGETHPDYAGSLNNLAVLYNNMGQYAKAEPLYIGAMSIRKKALGETHPDYATSLNNLAFLYANMGQYAKAEPLYIEAMGIRKKSLGETHPDYASSLNNLALLHDNMGQYAKAEPLYIEAMGITKKALGETHPDYATSLENLASLYISMSQYAKAEPLFIEAMEILKKSLGETHPDYATSLNNLAFLYESMGQYAKAETLYMEAMGIRKKALGETHPDYATSLENLVLLYASMNQYKKGEPLLIQNSQIVLKNLLNDFTVLSEKEKGNYFTNTISLLDNNNSFIYNYRKASPSTFQNNFNQQLIFKSLILSDSRNVLGFVQNSKDTIMQRLLKDWQANKNILSKQYSLSISDRRTDLKYIEINTENLEKELNRKSSEFRNQQNTIRISLKDVQKNLQKDEVAIEFVSFHLYNKKWTDSVLYVAYILTKNDSVPIFVPLCEEKQLQKLFDSAGRTATDMVSKFYRGLRIKNNNVASLGKELYKLVWEPLEPYLKGVEKISYSPAGKLYSIAFQALPVDSTTVLMDKYKLQQYTSTRQVVLRISENQTVKPASITLFGNASFTMDSLQLVKQKNTQTEKENVSTSIYTPQKRSSDNNTWNNLPGTAEEVSKIKLLFDQNKINTKSFIQTAASEENLKALSGNSPQILHIATHGFFLPEPDKKRKDNNFNNENTYTLADDPLLRSGLILAGGNYAWSGKTPIDGVEDGIATAYEISQLNLSNTELVVLSACETALGDVKGSEGVFGLQRAFKMAGVKKLIVSLWQVPDKETAELMTAFYGYWMQGKSINESFTQAQADMRKKYSPFYWAAFVLVE